MLAPPPFPTDPGKLASLGAAGLAYEGSSRTAINTYNIFPQNTPTAFTILGTVFDTAATFLLDTGAGYCLYTMFCDIWLQAKPAEHSLRPWLGNSLPSWGRWNTSHSPWYRLPLQHPVQYHICRRRWADHRGYPWPGFSSDQPMCSIHEKAHSTNHSTPSYSLTTASATRYLFSHGLSGGHGKDPSSL